MVNILHSHTLKFTNPILERFIDWMQSPMKSSFSTIVGVIDGDLEAGHYLMRINNGKKSPKKFPPPNFFRSKIGAVQN